MVRYRVKTALCAHPASVTSPSAKPKNEILPDCPKKLGAESGNAFRVRKSSDWTTESMGRPRKENPEKLPIRMYKRHGGYYYCDNSNKWRFLGRDIDAAIPARESILRQEMLNAGGGAVRAKGGNNLDTASTIHVARRLFNQAKSGSAERRLEFSISRQDVLDLFESSNGICSLSGLPFSFDRPSGARYALYAPSVDRIDSKVGYVAGNIRIVCSVVNLMKQELPEDVFVGVAIAIASVDRKVKAAFKSPS